MVTTIQLRLKMKFNRTITTTQLRLKMRFPRIIISARWMMTELPKTFYEYACSQNKNFLQKKFFLICFLFSVVLRAIYAVMHKIGVNFVAVIESFLIMIFARDQTTLTFRASLQLFTLLNVPLYQSLRYHDFYQKNKFSDTI